MSLALAITISTVAICLAVVICSYFDHRWPRPAPPPGPPEPDRPPIDLPCTPSDYDLWKEYYRIWNLRIAADIEMAVTE